ncbi:MAG: aminotransferase class III-fold pyridoxal phosphate-dependent enzyme [Candidatus Micrarchaeaceae archaeon]
MARESTILGLAVLFVRDVNAEVGNEGAVPRDEIAAIVLEPIQGEGGYIVPPKSFIKKIRKIASENGIVFVADEVQSGYFRTGKFLALENFGVEADIYTMAKALGGGLPIGATIARSSLGDIPAGSHSNTFGGNLVSIAAAKASLDYVIKNRKSLEDGVKKKSSIAFKRLHEIQDDYELIGDVRGIGLMIGIELVKSRKTKEPAIKEMEAILKSAFKMGLVMLPCGESSLRIIPPITIKESSLESGLDILEKAIKESK